MFLQHRACLAHSAVEAASCSCFSWRQFEHMQLGNNGCVPDGSRKLLTVSSFDSACSLGSGVRLLSPASVQRPRATRCKSSLPSCECKRKCYGIVANWPACEITASSKRKKSWTQLGNLSRTYWLAFAGTEAHDVCSWE